MPYIDSKVKEVLVANGRSPRTAGELNFLITNLAIDYLRENGICYQSFNDVIGALEGCKLELYRRMTSVYEDEKIRENGDVYNVFSGDRYSTVSDKGDKYE